MVNEFSIPQEYKEKLVHILEWYNKQYCPRDSCDPIPYIKTMRLIDELYTSNNVKFNVDDFYYIYDAAYYAKTNNATECGLTETDLIIIEEWASALWLNRRNT